MQIPGTCLLPEVTQRDQGRICVVIDLDETLVHSSFKVTPRACSGSRVEGWPREAAGGKRRCCGQEQVDLALRSWVLNHC